MAPGFFERIQAKIELFRLEQRYTKRRHRRSTFVSNAIYVDGEYIYQTPNTTGSSNNSSSESTYDAAYEPPAPAPAPSNTMSTKQRKRLNRFSSMPGFGSMGKRDSVMAPQDWSTTRNSYDGTR